MLSVTRRHIVLVFVCLAAILVAAACQQGAPAAPKEGAAPKEAPKAAAPKEQASAKPEQKAAAGAPIRIGMVSERTGVNTKSGEAAVRAAQILVEDLNARGGVLGRPLEVLYRDSKTAQDEAVRQARDLLTNEKVDFLLGGTNSAEFLAVSELAREAKKILFANCAVDDFTAKGHRYTFRVPNMTSRTQGYAAAKYLADNLPSTKTIAIIGHDFAFGRSVVDFFKARIKELKPDVQFVGGEWWPKMTETDYSSFITAIQSQKADVTLYSLGLAVPFFNQAAPVNLHKQTALLSAYWGGVDDITTLKQDAFPEGIVLGGFPAYVIDTPENKQFVDKYRAKFNEYPPPGGAYFMYMTMQFLTEAVKKAGTTETEKVVDALEGLELQTLVGKARMRPFDHQGATPYWLGKAKWDAQMKMGVLSEPVRFESEQFLPTEAEIKKLRGQ